MTAGDASRGLALASLIVVASCAGSANPSATADRITRAVYANDLDTTIASFDDATKKNVSRSDLGQMSDMMHRLGDFKSLTTRSSNDDSGRYEFDAAFTNGSMLVQLRIDPSGKVGAYRVSPEGTPTATVPSSKG